MLNTIDRVLSEGLAMYLTSLTGISARSLEEAIETGKTGLECQKIYKLCFWKVNVKYKVYFLTFNTDAFFQYIKTKKLRTILFRFQSYLRSKFEEIVASLKRYFSKYTMSE